MIFMIRGRGADEKIWCCIMWLISTIDWRHVYIMFEDMFLLCLKTHLHNCLRLFTQFLKIYFHHVKRHAFTIFLDIYKQGLKTLSYHVWRFVMTLCKDMLTISLKQVWCTMTTYVHFGNLFTYSNVWKHV